jgi:hypothetical protein
VNTVAAWKLELNIPTAATKSISELIVTRMARMFPAILFPLKTKKNNTAVTTKRAAVEGVNQ